MQSTSLANEVQRNPKGIRTQSCLPELMITCIVAISYRLRKPATAEDAVWPAIPDILEFMGEVMDVLKEGGF